MGKKKRERERGSTTENEKGRKWKRTRRKIGMRQFENTERGEWGRKESREEGLKRKSRTG